MEVNNPDKWAAACFAIIAVLVIFFAGDPDIADAIIYALTDGALKNG